MNVSRVEGARMLIGADTFKSEAPTVKAVQDKDDRRQGSVAVRDRSALKAPLVSRAP